MDFEAVNLLWFLLFVEKHLPSTRSALNFLRFFQVFFSMFVSHASLDPRSTFDFHDA